MRAWCYAKGKTGGTRQVRCEEDVFFHPELLQSLACWKHLALNPSNINVGADGWLEMVISRLRASTQAEGRLQELYSKEQGRTGCLVPIGRMSFYLKRGAVRKQKQKL